MKKSPETAHKGRVNGAATASMPYKPTNSKSFIGKLQSEAFVPSNLAPWRSCHADCSLSGKSENLPVSRTGIRRTAGMSPLERSRLAMQSTRRPCQSKRVTRSQSCSILPQTWQTPSCLHATMATASQAYAAWPIRSWSCASTCSCALGFLQELAAVQLRAWP